MGAEQGEKALVRYVLKWPMLSPVQDFFMPDDAVVIDVRAQPNGGVPTLWTLSSTDSVDVKRTFLGFGTGHPIMEPGLIYVGSAHEVEGMGLVFHIFERPPLSGVSDAPGTQEADRG